MTSATTRTTSTTSAPRGRDRLRELLDAVLDDDHTTVEEMAGRAHASPFHFSREVNRHTGEPPAALRRRVLLERAAWRLSHGVSVTDAAFEAGYDSVEGFSRAYARAYGHPPSRRQGDPTGQGHWLPAPNGIHFHAPASLWVREQERGSGADEVLGQQVLHDVDDTTDLLHRCSGLAADDLRRPLLPGHRVLSWCPPEESVLALLAGLVGQLEAWTAALEAADPPPTAPGHDGVRRLQERYAAVAPRWLAQVRDVARRDAWGDRLVDAVCEPPESFVVGGVVQHVVLYAGHRRLLVRGLLRLLGHDVDDGDPLMWQRRHAPGEADR